MHIAWCCLEEVPYCFSRSSIKFQGHTALKIVQFDPDWAFPDCNSSLNSPMAMKCCTKLEVAQKRSPIHDSHEIAILEFPTSDCSQNEAWCHAKRTDVTVPIENTWRRPNQHCKFNALVARIDDHSIVFNYAVWARCHHTVLNWPAILCERFVWCL